MSDERSDRYVQILQLAQQLSAIERLHLIADLSSDLAGASSLAVPIADIPDVSSETESDEDVGPMDGSLVITDRVNDPLSPLISPNGIDVETGQPLLTLDAAAIRRIAAHSPEPSERLTLHRARIRAAQPTLGMLYGKSYEDLTQAGWAVVVPAGDKAALIKALMPLIQHRCDQQGITLPPISFRDEETCGEWLARHAPTTPAIKSPWHPKRNPRVPVFLYETGLNCNDWLGRYGVSAGPVNPARGMPFYLLIVGRPGPLYPTDEAYIPFDFQYDLDIFWGVGRLCFTEQEGHHDYGAYTTYAEQVVQFEQRTIPPHQKHIVYFATRHTRDESTQASEEQLVLPLAQGDEQAGIESVAKVCGFTQEVLTGPSASRANLSAVLRGKTLGGKPALLFTATHGAGLRAADPRLLTQQGALICQDWSGIGPVKTEHWLAGDSLPEEVHVEGLIAVCFACYGVGCPATDQYAAVAGRTRQIAPRDIVAYLPQRLLTNGALAVLGHVDRAWSYSFSVPELGVKGQTQSFEDLLRRLMDGTRLGFATDQFNMRQAAFGGELSKLVQKTPFASGNPNFGLGQIGSLWKAYQDARSYALLGDPAAQVRSTST
jgi:hypothetical protein